MLLDSAQIGAIAGVSQLIQYGNLVVWVTFQHGLDKVTANKPGSAGH
jgi:hypothetical protein